MSVGSINAAIIAQGDYPRARDLWLGIDHSEIMELSDCGCRVLEGNYSLRELFTAIDEHNRSEGIPFTPLERLLARNIDEQKIRSSSIDFGLGTYSLSDSEEQYFKIGDIPEGRLVDYILASANYPLFQRQVIDGEVYIDGAVHKNVPVNLVPEKSDCRLLVVILSYMSPLDILDYISGYGHGRRMWRSSFQAGISARPSISAASIPPRF